MPQKTYSVQNCHPATLQNRRPVEPSILSAVKALFEDEVEPNTGGAAVAFHEWVGNVHFYVFVNDLVECVFRHFLNVA